MKTYKRVIAYAIWTILVVFATVSCKKYIDPPLVFEKDPGPNLTKDRKVLLISIDGLAGPELYDYTPVNMASMLEHAKYTFEGMADVNTHDAASWTTLLAGKASSKHGVHTDDFEDEVGDPDDPHGHEGGPSTGYITVYQRLLESGRILKTLSVTPWQPLDKYLFNLSDENGTVLSDEAAKDKAIDRIGTGEDNLAFAVVNFRDLNAAGLAGGFSLQNADYKTTLDRLDGYIGEILEAVTQRKRAANEDWLVIVTSNHGGTGNSYGGATFEERKVPVILYHPHFVRQRFDFPPVTNAFRARNGINGTMPAPDASAYNIGTSGEYTVQLKLMVHQFGSNNAAIISKQNNTGNPDIGWSFIHNGNDGWRLKVQGAQVIANGKKFDVGKWYTLTARIYMDGGTRKAQVFTDGELVKEGTLGSVQGSSTANFNVGFSTSWSAGTWIQSVKDLVVYNTALPIEYIQENYCKNPVDDAHQSNMIGSWSISDGLGSTLKNSVQGAPDFTINGNYGWEFLQNDFCKVLTGEEENKNQLLVNTTDILPQVFYWLDIETHDSWGLEGKVILDQFEQEFLGK